MFISRPGAFDAANEGTLFLDEITALPMQTQAMLLRVLESGYIRRLGGTKQIPARARLISAANENDHT